MRHKVKKNTFPSYCICLINTEKSETWKGKVEQLIMIWRDRLFCITLFTSIFIIWLKCVVGGVAPQMQIMYQFFSNQRKSNILPTSVFKSSLCFRADSCFDAFNLRTRGATRRLLISASYYVAMVKLSKHTPTCSHRFVNGCGICLNWLRKLMEKWIEKTQKEKP